MAYDRAAYERNREGHKQSVYAWRRRPTNLEKHRQGVRDWRAEMIALVDSFKEVPCEDCGGTFPPVCMDFDHRDGEHKVGNISRLRKTHSFDTVLKEMCKCDVVCANCHRIRTKARGQLGRHRNGKRIGEV